MADLQSLGLVSAVGCGRLELFGQVLHVALQVPPDGLQIRQLAPQVPHLPLKAQYLAQQPTAASAV